MLPKLTQKGIHIGVLLTKKQQFMSTISLIPKSSIARKQFVAITGLMLLGFVFTHLAGNLLIFAGANAFNAYAQNLANMRPALGLLEIGLALIFASHIMVTMTLVAENRRARNGQYIVAKNVGNRKVSSATMPYTGVMVMVFVILHLLDFTFNILGDPNETINNEDFGLYGLVYNSFSDPVHSGLYILTMIALGLHLSHALQSVFRTLGLFHEKYMPLIEKISFATGWIVAIIYSAIPLSILLGIVKAHH
jgi:succinate dehydrogenase / fumarate reductase cytochrome b subunit